MYYLFTLIVLLIVGLIYWGAVRRSAIAASRLGDMAVYEASGLAEASYQRNKQAVDKYQSHI